MEFRPCIDIHNGKVKQIVGGSLKDAGDYANENFVSANGSEYYAALFKKDNIKGAHVILLNGKDSQFFEATKAEALKALKTYQGGLQIGGGINAENATDYIKAGASHVIVTSFAFGNGEILWNNLETLKTSVGSKHIVLDLSARKKDGIYYVVTDRWQNFTNVPVTKETFLELSEYCDEFLVHGVDVEGLKQGVNEEFISILGEASKCGITITYAGGIASEEDIETIRTLTDGRVNFTVGSALDIYGGSLSYERLAETYSK